MLEVNIRALTEKAGRGMFPDYREHMKLIQSDMKHEAEALLNDSECIEVYQYYSVSPLCLLEAKMLHRMNVGISICYLDKTVQEYLEGKNLPEWIKKWYKQYLVYFFSSMDSIVVTREELQEKLRSEGIKRPNYYQIEKPGRRMNPLLICMWMAVYRQEMKLLNKRQLYSGKKRKMQCCMAGGR